MKVSGSPVILISVRSSSSMRLNSMLTGWLSLPYSMDFMSVSLDSVGRRIMPVHISR